MTGPLPTRRGNRAALRADGANRAWRTFLVALAVDVAISLILVLSAYFSDANSWGDLEWAVLAFSLVKTAVTSVGAYVLRTVLDPSRVPTPLPPTPQPAPADPA